MLEVVSPTERCAITTFDPDTLERDNRVLAGLARERENLFGVYARGPRRLGRDRRSGAGRRRLLTAPDGSLHFLNRRGVEQSGSSSGS